MPNVPIERVAVSAYRVPTSGPESDGTLVWDSTTLVLVEVTAGAVRGLGYTYADVPTALFVATHLAPAARGRDAMDVSGTWEALNRAVRDLGRSGVGAMGIAALDTALWDLKARLLHMPLVSLLGRVRSSVPVYGSGGFTSYSIAELQEQMAAWVRSGIGRVEMKVGRRPGVDVSRVKAAREAIGPTAELLVDANGAYDRTQAVALAGEFARFGVSWFEEPVSSDDLEGLRAVRDRAPAGMEIAAGEHEYTTFDFRRMLDADAVDVLQADATRCAGLTGFRRVAALAEEHHTPLSAHGAPALHAHLGCSVRNLRHIEYFHDHVRIERMFFDGVPCPVGGAVCPDPSRPGLGLVFKRQDAREYEVYESTS